MKKPKTHECPRCKGMGTVPKFLSTKREICPICKGLGELTTLENLRQRDLLDMDIKFKDS